MAEVVCDARDEGAGRVMTGAPDALVPSTPRTPAFAGSLAQSCSTRAERDCPKRPGSRGRQV